MTTIQELLEFKLNSFNERLNAAELLTAALDEAGVTREEALEALHTKHEQITETQQLHSEKADVFRERLEVN